MVYYATSRVLASTPTSIPSNYSTTTELNPSASSSPTSDDTGYAIASGLSEGTRFQSASCLADASSSSCAHFFIFFH